MTKMATEIVKKMRREGNKVIETTIIIRSAVVEYADILEAVEVKPDDESDAPWDNCDGLEHDITSIGHEDERQARGVIRRDRDYHNRRIIITKDQTEHWGVRQFARDRGATKQVAFELAARNVQTTIDYLLEWYNGERCHWFVVCEFLDEYASCGGIDDYKYASGEMKHEIAGEVADDLEQKGYTVRGIPKEKKRAYNSKVNDQNWTG